MTLKISHCSHPFSLNPCRLQTFEYQIDPYIGCEHYCYYCYVLDRAETDWRKEIMIYPDIVAQLSGELKKIPPQTIYMGTHTDPYQPCEAFYHQTRKVLNVLLDAGFSASILTKSDLVVRDLDIIGKMEDGAVSVSVAFSDNQTHRLFEANTQETARRIEALKKCREAGIKTGALICPVIPYVTDVIRMIDMLESYADTIWIYGLSMADQNGQNRKYMQTILNHHYPELAEEIRHSLKSRQDHYWTRLSEKLKRLKDERDLDLRIHV